MSYTVTITKTVEVEQVEQVYMSELEAKAAGFEKAGYVDKAIKRDKEVKIYEQTVNDDDLNINSVIKAVMGEGK